MLDINQGYIYHIFTHYLINGAIYEWALLIIECVFLFSIHILHEIFFILRIIELEVIKIYIALRVKYP
jgi:uncharacterized membrane protein